MKVLRETLDLGESGLQKGLRRFQLRLDSAARAPSQDSEVNVERGQRLANLIVEKPADATPLLSAGLGRGAARGQIDAGGLQRVRLDRILRLPERQLVDQHVGH